MVSRQRRLNERSGSLQSREGHELLTSVRRRPPRDARRIHEDERRMGPDGAGPGLPRARRRACHRAGRVRGVPRGRRQGLREVQPRPDLRGGQGLPGLQLHELPHGSQGARGSGGRQEAAEPESRCGAPGQRVLPVLPRRPREDGPLGGQRPPARGAEVRELSRRAQPAHRDARAGEDPARGQPDHQEVPRVPRGSPPGPAGAVDPPDARRPDGLRLLPQPCGPRSPPFAPSGRWPCTGTTTRRATAR